MVGNVYLGRVQNVLPSMEAAFVDIGKGRNAVIYAGEVNLDDGHSGAIDAFARLWGEPLHLVHVDVGRCSNVSAAFLSISSLTSISRLCGGGLRGMLAVGRRPLPAHIRTICRRVHAIPSVRLA